MYRLFRCLCLCVIVICTLLGSLAAEEYTYDFQRIIKVDRRCTLDLRFVNGNVTVQGELTDRVIIDAVKTVRATDPYEAEEVAAHIEIKVRQEKETIRVETNYLRMLNRSRSFWDKVLGMGDDSYGQVDYIIKVPVECDLIIHGSAGAIAAADIAGPVSITASNADIELSSIEGAVDIENLVGNTTVEYVIGPVTVSQPEGRITLDWIEGDIRLKSRSSAIDIRQVRGALDLITRTGEVNVQTELDSRNDYFVETESGRISFSIPESASALLRLESETGRVSTDVPVAVESMSRSRLVGRRGRGGVTVTITSRSGDVVVGLY